MTENDNSTPNAQDIIRLAQDDPEVARNMATALAEVAPEQAAAAAAEVAPKRAAAAAARAAPEQAAAAAAEVAPERAAAAAMKAAPNEKVDDIVRAMLDAAPRGYEKSIATNAMEGLYLGDKKDIVQAGLEALTPAAARSIDYTKLQEHLAKSNNRWLTAALVFATILALFTFVILVTISGAISQEKGIVAAFAQEWLTIIVTIAAALAGYCLGRKHG
jgi:hypothetical protein